MKKIITLLAVAFTAHLSIGQTAVFQSDLSSWSAGNPTDFFGGRTNISSSNVTEVNMGATYGTSLANIVNTSSSHKRFTTQPFYVMPDSTYIITMWVAGTAGDLRVSHYDVPNGNYGSYTDYQTVNSGATLMVLRDTVTVSSSTTEIEYILSLRNTAATGIALDSVVITGALGTPPPPPTYNAKSIYEIQYTTDFSGDSPYEDSTVELTGIVTGISTDTRVDGYFIQDSAAAWNGIFVNDEVNVPSRGDKVTVTGKVVENYNNTQLGFVDTMIVVSSGNSEPTPIAVTSTTAADEMYEGVLLEVTDVMCVDTVVSFGEWFVAGTGLDTLMIDDLLLSTTYNPVLYRGYSVTGILYYSFSNFKVEPRDSTDLLQSLVVSIDENQELTLSVFPNPVSTFFTLEGVNLGTAEIMNAEGKIVRSISLNYISTIDVSELTNGVYIIKVTSDNKVGFTRFVKQ